MNINTALQGIDGKYSSKVARGQAEELAALSRGLSEAPTLEIEELINQFQRLRTRLHDAGNRIQRDIAQYTELSQQTMQLTAIISDGVRKLPPGTLR